MTSLVLIGLGGNLASPRWGPPRDTLAAALVALNAEDVVIATRSSWYRSAPLPVSDQPWFFNGVASVGTVRGAPELLALMLAIEERFGRVRGLPNAARVLDLDLLDYRGELITTRDLVLPHPRLHQRRFVLEPLAEIAPAWRHPVLRLTAQQLLAQLGTSQAVERLPG